MRRGFLGGTFNPPHLGHVRAAAAAAEELGLDVLYVIPAGIPPHKELPEGSADGVYGSGTAAALSAFQAKLGIAATGAADVDTQKRLYAEDAPRVDD